jgi:hypothetical protein
MGEWLRAAIFGVGVCLLTAAALADEGAKPDHAQAEARSGAETSVPTTEKTQGALDHEEAEARGAPRDAVPGPEFAGPTDHATVESRGAAPQK